ncbi:MAG: hypothetical protein ACJ735_05595 [Actinomycetes bacterium]
MPSSRFVRISAAASAGIIGLALATIGSIGSAHAATPRVLRVGTYKGIPGTYTSVQKAVSASHANDWVLVGPGDYKENGYAGAPEPAGVLITTTGLHLRGMDRNKVVIDGTKPGTPTCSNKKADQIFTKDGRDGVMALKVDGTYIENLTTCNYLTGNGGGEGNEIWWNGGDGSGKIGMGSFWGNYITGTSTYSNGTADPRGEYGIFTSNTDGPGVIDQSYASNMGDAAYYIGACPNCNQILSHAHGEFSALGYSGTNSGGNLTIENSEFDQNKSGIVSNSQNNDDQPSPQIGKCPGGGTGPLKLGICTIWKDNYVHDNNNPNVPGAGAGSLAGSGPTGAGFVLAGSQNIAIVHNRVVHNGSWGVLVTDLPDQENPPDGFPSCKGGTVKTPPIAGEDAVCYYQAFGNAVVDNTFTNNGFFGNPTNGDIGLLALPHNPGNCAEGNTNTDGTVSTDPPTFNSNPLYACADPIGPNGGDVTLQTIEALCATALLFQCPQVEDPPVINYPQTTGVTLHMPPAQPTMPDPCAGVPANPWCPAAATKPTVTHNLATTGLRTLLPLAAVVLLAVGSVTRRRLRTR